MYLVDTDVVSELRRGPRAHAGVRAFFANAARRSEPVYLSVITIGELQRGVALIRHRGDDRQAERLASWLDDVVEHYAESIAEFGIDEATVWGRLRVPHPENALDKQIAATALTHGWAVVTRNVGLYAGLGVAVVNPYAEPGRPNHG